MEKYDKNRIINRYDCLEPGLVKFASQSSDTQEMLSKENYAGHIVENGLVLSIEREEALLLRRKGDDVWFTLTCHLESLLSYAGDAVLREIQDLTGIDCHDLHSLSAYHLDNYEVDIHTAIIPENLTTSEPQHRHFEFRYAFNYKGAKELNVADGIEYKWVSMDDPYLFKVANITKIKSAIKTPKYEKVLLNIMHSSPEIPDWNRYKYRAELEKRILKDTAWFTDRLFSSEQCYSVVYPYSRYYSDVEQSNFDLCDREKENMLYPNTQAKNRFRKELSYEEKTDISQTYFDHYAALRKMTNLHVITLNCTSFSDDDPKYKDVDVFIRYECKASDLNVATFKLIQKCFSKWRVAIQKDYDNYRDSLPYHQIFTIKINKRLYMDIVNGKPMYNALSDVRKAILELYNQLLKRPLTPNDYARNTMSEAEIMAIQDTDISSFYARGMWGSWYRDKLLIEAKYNSTLSFHCGLADVMSNGKYGYIDKMERMVVPAIYDYAWTFVDGLAPVGRDGKMFLINTKGKEVVHLKCDKLGSIKNGVVSAEVNGKWGYFNIKGEPLTEFIYDDLSYIKRRIIVKDGKYGLMNDDYTVAVECIYDNLSICSEEDGVFYVQRDGKGFLINAKGEELMALKDTFVSANYEALPSSVVLRRGGKYGVCSCNGNMLLDFKYDRICNLDDVFVLRLDDKYGIANENGEVLIPLIYDSISDFDEGLTVGKKDEKYDIINNKGEILVASIDKYDYISPFWKGLAQVVCEGRYSFIDKSCELVMPLYDSVVAFSRGFAIVCNDDLCGVVNLKGELVVELKYKEIGRFDADGTAEFVSHDGRRGKIDTEGNEIYSHPNISADDFRIGKLGL